MASITRRLLLSTEQSAPRLLQQCATQRGATQWQRSISSTPSRQASKDKDTDSPPKATNKAAAKRTPAVEKAADGMSKATAQKTADGVSKAPNASQAESQRPNRMTPDERRAAHTEKLNKELQEIKGMSKRPRWNDEFRMPERAKGFGFWAQGEPELGPDEDFYGDDITSHGHGELEKHRELREYARLIAWELPLLNQLAKPFTLPTAKTPFRFRYTSYLGEEHPATNKVVVEFCSADMPNLNEKQRSKLIKLCGPRYNPSNDEIKISCELYDTQAQNKRHIADQISRLLNEARDLKDDFSDVPFDFRHHKPTKKHEFPKEWILTEERKKYLEEKRAKSVKEEDHRRNFGNLVDGQRIVEKALPFTAPVAEPVLVGGPRGKAL